MLKTIRLQEARIEGNSILFSTYPITGILGLVSFVDNVDGVDGTHSFQKSFRISTDGVNFGEWTLLTIGNLQAITLTEFQVVSFELQYFKNQPIGDDDLSINTIDIKYNYQTPQPQEIFDKTIFKNFFQTDDIAVLNWYMNVLNKLYNKGLVANYIDRKNHNEDPIDYIQLWSSVAKFFSYYVVYARQFQNFHESEILLFEFLEQRGIKISSFSTLPEMNEIMENFYIEMSKRGTIRIVDKKEEGESVEGELLRLINYDSESDEVLFNPRLPQHIGWNLGNSSPLHRGLKLHQNLNKALKNILLGGVEVTDGSKTVLSGQNFTFTQKLKIHSRMNYLLFFSLKTSGKISVKMTSYDKNNTLLDSYSQKDGSIQQFFFTAGSLYRSDKYLPISLNIYNSQKKPFLESTTSLHQGQDLSLNPGTVWLNFEITTVETALIEEISLTPSHTPYSAGFLQMNNAIDLFAVNNNHQHTFKSICRWISKNLIPYNSNLLTTDLDDLKNIDTTKEVEVRETVWIGGESFCEKLGWRPITPTCELIDTIWIGEEATAYCKKIIV